MDAGQGVEAQTVSNVLLAMEHDLEIIPVINKIDLPSAEVDRVVMQIHDLLGVEEHDILKISAKNGIGIQDVLDAIIYRIPAPTGAADAPLQGLVFDSIFDRYRGAVAYVRIFQGTLRGPVPASGSSRPAWTTKPRKSGYSGWVGSSVTPLGRVRWGISLQESRISKRRESATR